MLQLKNCCAHNPKEERRSHKKQKPQFSTECNRGSHGGEGGTHLHLLIKLVVVAGVVVVAVLVVAVVIACCRLLRVEA